MKINSYELEAVSVFGILFRFPFLFVMIPKLQSREEEEHST